MNKNNIKQKLDNEINRRIASASWDFEIANKVLASRRKTKKRVIYFSSLSSFSFACLAILFFIFGISNKPPHDNIYQTFITKQVEGTYNLIIYNNKPQPSLLDNNIKDSILVNEIDHMIDDTLSMRQ